jgi:hypothetical protein
MTEPYFVAAKPCFGMTKQGSSVAKPDSVEVEPFWGMKNLGLV